MRTTRTPLLRPALLLSLLVAPLLSLYAFVPQKVDKNHSTVGFTVPIMGGLSKVTGKFTEFDIDFDWNEADPTKSTVKATVAANSIKTGIDARDHHLNTADFFDTEKYPTITFVSKKVEKKQGFVYVTGDFTMRGVTKEVTLNVVPLHNEGTASSGLRGFRVYLPIDRTDYGVSYEHKQLPDFIGNKVEIEIDIICRDLPPAPPPAAAPAKP